eukprot:m.232909 g.232909  ORF g.232909 m.232909 type:complete len:158 (+) comp16022_c0_seq27:1696-2169(+)
MVHNKLLSGLLCNAKGTIPKKLGLTSTQCPACEGARYLTRRQIVCRVCRAKGWVKSGFFSTQGCPSCHGKCYVNRTQNPCQLCKGLGVVYGGLFSLYKSKNCIACSGAGLVVGNQHQCRCCSGTGKVGRETCPLCEGKELISRTSVESVTRSLPSPL